MTSPNSCIVETGKGRNSRALMYITTDRCKTPRVKKFTISPSVMPTLSTVYGMKTIPAPKSVDSTSKTASHILRLLPSPSSSF